jgi:transcriptional regulator with XRE-family HTH domain
MAHNDEMHDEELLVRLKACPIEEVCHYLAMRVRKHRQETGQTQAEFAENAGIPLRTYKRFETNGKANLETFVAVLRSMDRTHYVFMLFPSPSKPTSFATREERLRLLKTRVDGL